MPLPALFLIALGIAASAAFFTGMVSGLHGAGLNVVGALLLIFGVLWSGMARRKRARQRED
ncbi:MAG: hypothetical protein GYB53_00575 [Rhodobacteraceae bacterium]|nr:hypothetical protein [Paracoccaceae bacterium]MBR9821600.1 hypothetical protein [Paracoccaceae bacterium]